MRQRTRPAATGRPIEFKLKRRPVFKIVQLRAIGLTKGATHWSTRTLAEHLGLDKSMVARIWRAHELALHRMCPDESIWSGFAPTHESSLLAELVESYRSFCTALHVQHAEHVTRENVTISSEFAGAADCDFVEAGPQDGLQTGREALHPRVRARF
jgi:hypothetical protein